MRENPELYGLRRSSRPTKQPRIIDSDASDDNESDSDVVPTNRRTKKLRAEKTSQQSSKRGTPTRQVQTADSDSDTYGGARA
ncbi:hypothetical protein Micbo1qcDRAFT_161988, partial [Microdochium bolleyi]